MFILIETQLLTFQALISLGLKFRSIKKSIRFIPKNFNFMWQAH